MGEYLQKLKKLRIAKGVSQKEIAAYLQISPAAYSLYEIGKREPNITILKKIAEYYNTSVDDILGIKDDEIVIHHTEHLLNDLKKDNTMSVEKQIDIRELTRQLEYYKMEYSIKQLEKHRLQTQELAQQKKTLLIEAYNKLNEHGQDEAIKRIQELSQLPLYTQEPTLNAAHENNPTPEQQNLVDQMMKDDSEWD